MERPPKGRKGLGSLTGPLAQKYDILFEFLTLQFFCMETLLIQYVRVVGNERQCYWIFLYLCDLYNVGSAEFLVVPGSSPLIQKRDLAVCCRFDLSSVGGTVAAP